MDKLTEAIYDAAFISIQSDGEEDFWEWFRIDYYQPEADEDNDPYLHYHQEDYPGDEFMIYRKDLEEGIREGTIKLYTIAPIDITL